MTRIEYTISRDSVSTSSEGHAWKLTNISVRQTTFRNDRYYENLVTSLGYFSQLLRNRNSRCTAPRYKSILYYTTVR